MDFGFGCPRLNDKSFPNIPTFFVIGRPHFDLMSGRLFPVNHQFVNQDLDPYLHGLYLEFDASPRIEASLRNTCGVASRLPLKTSVSVRVEALDH